MGIPEQMGTCQSRFAEDFISPYNFYQKLVNLKTLFQYDYYANYAPAIFSF
jgi:hypothetical protein